MLLRWATAEVVEHLPQPLRRSLKAHHYAGLLNGDLAMRDGDLHATDLLVGNGDYVIDVGANVGVWAHYLARLVGDGGRVFAFEPVPECFAVLDRNLKRFHRENVVASAHAISDVDGRVQISVPRDSRGLRNFHLARVGTSQSRKAFSVDSISLDSWFIAAGAPRVSFVKVDTEGHELACLRGMLTLIEYNRPSLCLEISTDLDKSGSDGSTILRELESRGYSAHIWTGGSFVKRHKSQQAVNYFFLRPEHVSDLAD